MDILQNPKIRAKLDYHHVCDLVHNNNKMQIIIPLVDNVEDRIRKLLNNFISGDKVIVGHHYLYNLFALADMNDPCGLIKLIIKSTIDKLAILKEAVADSNKPEFNIGMYLQIWQSYKSYTKQVYFLVKNYQKY